MAKRTIRWLTTGLLLAATTTGCASFTTGDGMPATDWGQTTPEFDYLVGRDLELDGKPAEALEAYSRALSKDPESVFLLKQVAELSARQNRLTDAVVYAERAMELDPEDVGVRLFLGTVYRFRKDTDGALRVLRDDAGDPIDADAALLLYGILSDARRYGEAREIAERMIADDPDSLRGYLALSDAMERLGDPQAAEEALRRGLRLQPGDFALYGALARTRRERGDRVGEIEIYDEYLAIEPGHHATLLARADAELALGRNEAAVATLEEIERLYPSDLRTVLRLAFLEFEQDQLESAERRFARALAAQPDQHEVAYFLGVTRRRLTNDAGAREAFERVPPGHDRFGDARVQIAGIYERSGDLAAAIAEVNIAREAQPARPLDLYLASLQAKDGDVDGALEFLDTLLEDSPGDAEVLYNIGVIHGEARNVDEAIRYMEIVLGKDPDHAGALNYVGYTWAERGTNLDAAEEMISRALELRPDDGYIADSLGWVYYKRAAPLLESGQVAEAHALLDRALVELQRAAELTGGDPVIAEHMGDAYLALGEKRKALRMYQEAVRLEPRPVEQPDLHDKLERLQVELGAR